LGCDLLALLLVVSISASQQPGARPHIVRVFEDGRFIQVLYGDPDREGGHYVIRIGNDDGQIVFPHRHPEDEHIVVIQGTWFMGHGEVFDREVLKEMPVGTYGVVPKTMLPKH
jgi:quercetin dioxygenase-like cupin family protein